MQAVLVKSPGPAENMYIGSADIPQVKPHEVLIRVKATALNRADLLQRLGRYPPPPGVTDIIGLEAAGEIASLGSEVSGTWKEGQRVCCLLSGGGYAQYASVPAAHLIPVPDNLSFEQAATIPEAWMTAYQLLYRVGELGSGKINSVLLHAGASGIGVAAIQLAKQHGAKVIVTAGSEDKLEFCRQLGADAGINYKSDDFSEKVLELTNKKGVDMVCDPVGADYFAKNLACLAEEGRYVLYGFLSGSKLPSAVDLAAILRKRIRLEGTTLRARSEEYKASLAQDVAAVGLERFANGQFQLPIDRVFPWQEIQEAHRYMESNQNKGKIVITVE